MAGLPPERISRFLTYLLRHRPKEYPLVFDQRGFVEWRDVVAIVQERYYEVTEEDIRAVVTDSQKKRFEIEGDSVRATYGHSFPVDLGREAAEPPDQLYYGAARDLAQSMLRNGLKPRDRQYVHLSLTAEEAESVARRHDPSPAVLVVDAQAASAEGIQFYRSGPLFLVENVPAKFLASR
ncbi:MAG TPA: RNA 2'-phosphotransferase [Candidatus Binatia bacterium]|jgi:putative RNA 2'-phosphotransferase